MSTPIVIVGTGRCGSTLLHRLLARHGELGWLSPLNETLPDQTWLAALSRAYDWPLPDRLKRAKAFPKPYEAYRFWEHYLPGFSRRDRPPTAADVPAAGIGPVRRACERIVRRQHRERLLVKVTGWSRIEYFDRIFPGVLFVSLRRDPRSVVSSWVQAGWLDVTSAPESPGWEWGPVPDAYMRAWRELGEDPTLSASVKIRLDLDDIDRNVARLPERCHELSYEQLIADPERALRSLCEFCELGWNSDFERIVGETRFYDSRNTWRRHLTEVQAERIMQFFAAAENHTPASNRGPAPVQADAEKGRSTALPPGANRGGTSS